VTGGTIDVAGGDLTVALTGSGASFTNQGSLSVTGGNVTVSMAGTSPVFTNEGTITVDSPRSFSVSNSSDGAFTNAATGILQGTGTFDVTAGSPAFTNLGTIAPGLSPGTLTWLGNIVNTSTARLDIELNGTIPDTEYDRLDVAGNVTLNGDLVVTRTFTPTLGDRFAIMMFAGRTGQFANVSLPLVDGLVLDTLWAIDADPVDTLYLVANAPPVMQILFAGDSASDPSASGLLSVNPDGSGQFQITSEGPPAAVKVHPRWSPDRTRVTYTANPGDGINLLHVGAADGSAIAHLVNDTSTFRPRYNADGKRLAFECGDDDADGDPRDDDVCTIADVSGPVAMLDVIGDGAGKLFLSKQATGLDPSFTRGPASFAWNPAVSDEIAFFRDSVSQAGDTVSHLIISSYDGTGMTLVTPAGMDAGGGPLKVVGTFDWSPDGSLIAFAATDGSDPFTSHIYVIGANGSGLKALTPTGSGDFGPVFSPDGLEILYASLVDGIQLFRVPSDGSGVEVAASTCCFNYSPVMLGYDYSPDGAEIVLTDDQAFTFGVKIVKILRTTTDGTYFADVIVVGRRGVSFEVQDRQPSWRP
jgi:dipeptidyl aminopeptidase/acylaminoacyl peptidase